MESRTINKSKKMESDVDYSDIAPDSETVCRICNAEFLDPEDLTMHLTQFHASEHASLVPCHFCHISLPDLETYACHIRDKHLKSLKLCTYCSKAFTEIDELKTHERKHYSAKKYNKKCSQCSVQFDNTSHLEQHEYEHHNNTLNGILLHDYSPIFSSVFNIKLFTLLRSIGTNVTHSCISCNYRSNNLGTYINHLQINECRSFACNNCSNIYKGKKNMFKHVKMNTKCGYFTKKLETEQKCPHCFKNINSIFFFNHIKQCKPIKCNQCKIVFKSLNSLSEHQSQEHPVSVEVETCKFCSRQCVGSNAILKHMIRVHKQEFHLYKYKCVQCETVFKHPKRLFAHYFLNHKELEPYTCKICDKKFRIRKRFTLHIKLDHKSVGFVEFDKNYHVFFSETKSENPFTPTCVIPEEELLMYNDYQEQIDSNVSAKQHQEKDELYLEGFNQTETEGHNTELEMEAKNNNLKRKKKLNTKGSKRITRRNVEETISLDSSDDDNEPLVTLTKRRQVPIKKPLHMLFKMKNNSRKNNRKKLTCNKCNKYCYTFQNYEHHMSLHKKNERKHCIKCFKVFKSKEKLNKHIETEHSSSKLTETLRLLIEKRKKGTKMETKETSKRERFMSTIKKSKTDNFNVTATIKLVEKDLSLQKFIENFTPETNDVAKNKNAIIENSVTIKVRNSPFYREPVIKMTKFEPEPIISTSGKLALPVKFKQDGGEKVTVTLRVVHVPTLSAPQFTPREETMNDYHEENYSDHFDDTEQCKNDTIPEVAEEILLEETEELPKPVQEPRKIIIPKLPKGYKQISIAHLLPEAPFFKIVKVKDVLNEEEKVEKKDIIKLSDGTKLVTVNPLAHLLGDKKIEQIIGPGKNKYYKPKMGRNVENLFNKAIEKANTPSNTKKKRKNVQNDSSNADN